MVRDIIYIAIFVAVAHAVKQYRSDYEYSGETDAFYKLHTEGMTYGTAKEICQLENAKLIEALPKDIVQAHGMLKRFPDIEGFVWAGEDGEPHGSVEEFEERILTIQEFESSNYYIGDMCEVITRDGKVLKIDCFDLLPFICKVDAKDVYQNSQCNVFTRGYQYLESVGSCYRVSRPALSWNQAYAECQAEGAHLLVLNSEQEREAVHNLTLPGQSDPGLPWYYAGIRAEKKNDGSPLVFKTIFGKTLEEAGYAEWCPGEPNNWAGDEICGSITRSDGKYNDIACYHTVAFICEKEVNVQKLNT